MKRIVSIKMLFTVSLATLFMYQGAPSLAQSAGITVTRFIDADNSGADSPGDEVLFGNSAISLRFRFADLSTRAKKVDPRFNGYYLDTVKYRDETCFKHPDWETESALYPTLEANDVVGMTAFTSDRLFRSEPFLWMWNIAREPVRNMSPDMKWIMHGRELQSYEWYTLYEKHEVRGDTLAFVSEKRRNIREELLFTIDNNTLRIRFTVTNKMERPLAQVGIIVFPANRIIDTVYAQPDVKAARKIAPTGFTDNYTFTAAAADGLAGSGMLFWSRGEDSLLHMDGLYSWHKFSVQPGESTSRELAVTFNNKNIDDYYSEYLRANNIEFDTIDWKAAEDYMVSKVPEAMNAKGYVWHAYDYNPPGTDHDWHNEMTGRAFMVQYLATGDQKWLEYTKNANLYYLDNMFFKNPDHVCHGYFMDQTYADKTHDCYPWSQPYNVESFIAEYAVTKDESLKQALLLHFDRMYDGPLYNPDGHRWYWVMHEKGDSRDFATFDAQEFGMDVMISAYEFTGDRKYLQRAIEVMNAHKYALDNFGLLLEDRAGEPSVNTFAFAAKVLFKLYDYTGDKYWLDRAVRILNATVYSRVFMEPYGPDDAWLKGALARKDSDWRGQFGEPNTGTDSSAPSETTYIPWVMEALVAGYNHTGKEMYIQYIGQLLHHQMEANKRLAEATGGAVELCGHYNMFNGTFLQDNDGLTVVSNLFLFPYVNTFLRGVRSPQSSVVLAPGDKSIRLFHLSGIKENVSVQFSKGKILSVRAVKIEGGGGTDIEYKSGSGTISFEASPYQMYEIAMN
jgi:hypothetical protein